MIYYSEEIGKNELTETLIQKLIKTAAEQLIHILKWGQHFWLQTARFIPDAI